MREHSNEVARLGFAHPEFQKGTEPDGSFWKGPKKAGRGGVVKT